jgi:hypothetical protein
MVNTVKFSQFTDGGDLVNDDTTVGLRSGTNTRFNNPWTFLPSGSTGTRPAPDPTMYYRLRLNTSLRQYEFYDPVAVAWVQLAAGEPLTFIWQIVTSGPVTMMALNGYFTNSATTITLQLPASSIVGDTISVANMNTGGFRIAQGSGQQIHISPSSTTMSTGSVSSTGTYDSLTLVCNQDNVSWIAVPGVQGILTIV